MLRDLQLAFASAVDDSAPIAVDGLFAGIRGGGERAAKRLAVYRNTIAQNRINALSATYSAVASLVGEEFFAHMATAFAARVPSHSGDLEKYGAEFADFIAGFPPAASLPYLSDVARLERAIDELLVASDVDSPVRTIRSAFPLLRIWQVTQPGSEPSTTIDLSEGGVTLVLRRIGFEVVLEVAPQGEHDA